MPDTAQWVAIAVAVLMGGLGRDLLGWLKEAVVGRPKKRDELQRAWDERDEEARRRRIVEEVLSLTRRIALGAPCLNEEDIPPFPTYGPKH